MPFIDALSRFLIAAPTANSTAETAARTLANEVIRRCGAPVILTTDNGTAFTAELLQRACKILEITHLTTAPYAPQSNEPTERAHQTMKTQLRQSSLSNEHRTTTFRIGSSRNGSRQTAGDTYRLDTDTRSTDTPTTELEKYFGAYGTIDS